MKMKVFKENYQIVDSKKGVKCVPKSAGGYPDAMTADGTIYSPEERYFFFDTDGRSVRQSVGLRRIDETWLGSFGLRVVEISKLRINRTDALADGQNFFRERIENLQESIERFELEKAVEANHEA